VSYQETATSITAAALGHLDGSGEEQHCGFCGRVAPAQKAWKALKNTFTNGDELHSEFICDACVFCLNDKRTRSSFVATRGEFRRLLRSEIWPTLLEPPEPPFALYLTVSGKKHGLFRQRLATSRDSYQVVAEELVGHFDRRSSARWMRHLIDLTHAGVRRATLETGKYGSGDYIAAMDMIRDLEPALKPVRGSDLWAIVFGLMPGRKDMTDKLCKILDKTAK